MKKNTGILVVSAFVILFSASIFAQGTAFTYQGQLQNNGAPANGSYDLQFILFTTNQFGFPAAPILTNAAVTVNNGLFTTTLDFGGGVFTGTNFWLDISVRTNGNGAFTDLSPRQPLTPAPYAITAETAETVNNLSGLTVQQNTNGSPNLIGGSPVNFVSAGFIGATIAGGGAISFDGASYTNSVTSDFGTVSGGNANTASYYGTVGGGGGNTSRGLEFATVGGGEDNTSGGSWATVPGGKDNFAVGDYSFAAGRQAQALHQGAFVLADSQNAAFSSTANDQYLIRAQGGVGINTNNPNGASLSVAGNRTGVAPNAFMNPIVVFENTSTAVGSSPALRVIVDGGDSPSGALTVSANGTGNIAQFGNRTAFVVNIANDGTLTCKALIQTSDRNAKENFTTLDAQTVLARVVAMPVTEWNYKDDAADKKHIGPMAQDFHAAFGLNGSDDKHISAVDEGGVALAAIQGLNQKLAEALKRRDAENAALKVRLDKLEKMILDSADNR